MRKVKLHFMLIGKTEEAIKRTLKGDGKTILGSVKDIVAENFGRRTMVISDEKSLLDESKPYPRFYAAGWFVEDFGFGKGGNEVVLVVHGESMEMAQNTLFGEMKKFDLDKYAIKI